MGIGLNLVTSTEASNWVQNSAFQVLSEGGLKAFGRPAFIMADTKSDYKARKYSATREVIFQLLSMAAYFAIITTVFQKLGFKALKKFPKFKDFEVLKDINNFSEFSHVFGAFSKGKIKTTEKEALELEKAKGGMELIKIAGSVLILTILCPILGTKLVHPIMKALKLNDNNTDKTVDVKS